VPAFRRRDDAFNSFWTIELEEGWSLFATHPVNRSDLPFRLLSGIVDSDRFYDGGINFPAVWTDPAFCGVLRRGTPVAQCFPVPRSSPELVFATFDAARQAAYSNTVAEVLTKPGVYRKRFRVKRALNRRVAVSRHSSRSTAGRRAPMSVRGDDAEGGGAQAIGVAIRFNGPVHIAALLENDAQIHRRLSVIGALFERLA